MFYLITVFGKLVIEREWYEYGWKAQDVAFILPGHEDKAYEIRAAIERQWL